MSDTSTFVARLARPLGKRGVAGIPRTRPQTARLESPQAPHFPRGGDQRRAFAA